MIVLTTRLSAPSRMGGGIRETKYGFASEQFESFEVVGPEDPAYIEGATVLRIKFITNSLVHIKETPQSFISKMLATSIDTEEFESWEAGS